MADVWIVLLKRGSGEIGGAYSLLSDAQASIGPTPICSYEIIKETIDANVGVNISNAIKAGPVIKNSTKGTRVS